MGRTLAPPPTRRRVECERQLGKADDEEHLAILRRQQRRRILLHRLQRLTSVGPDAIYLAEHALNVRVVVLHGALVGLVPLQERVTGFPLIGQETAEQP